MQNASGTQALDTPRVIEPPGVLHFGVADRETVSRNTVIKKKGGIYPNMGLMGEVRQECVVHHGRKRKTFHPQCGAKLCARTFFICIGTHNMIQKNGIDKKKKKTFQK